MSHPADDSVPAHGVKDATDRLSTDQRVKPGFSIPDPIAGPSDVDQRGSHQQGHEEEAGLCDDGEDRMIRTYR